MQRPSRRRKMCSLLLDSFSHILGLTVGELLRDYWGTLGNLGTCQLHPVNPGIPSVWAEHEFWKQDERSDPLVPQSRSPPPLGVHQRRHECKTLHNFFSEFRADFGEGPKSKGLPKERAWVKKIRAGQSAGEGEVPGLGTCKLWEQNGKSSQSSFPLHMAFPGLLFSLFYCLMGFQGLALSMESLHTDNF